MFSGYHGTHHPPALLFHCIEDNAQEAQDEAEFGLPYTQSVLDRFMSNMSVSHDEQRSFASAQVGEVSLQWICLSYTM